MNWALNDEQQQLKDALRRMLDETYGFEQRRAISAEESGWSRSAWTQLCEMGTVALGVGEEQGGIAGSAADIAVVMTELGRALSLEPYLATAVLAAAALRPFAAQDHAAALLAGIAAGSAIVAWGHDEAAARHDFFWVETRAKEQGGQWLLTGTKQNVLHAAAADHLIVSARVQGASNAEDGIGLFLVAPSTRGVRLRAHRLVDESAAGELQLDDATAIALGDPLARHQQKEVLRGIRAAGIGALCAEALGVLETAFELTCSYANTRQQFGRPLGANQAYRHQLAEMAVALESCRSAAGLASAAVDATVAVSASSNDTSCDLLRAKLLIGLHGRNLCHQAVQLHGGIGVTEEYKVGHCLRRLFVIDQLFGDSDSQASLLAKCLVEENS